MKELTTTDGKFALECPHCNSIELTCIAGSTPRIRELRNCKACEKQFVIDIKTEKKMLIEIFVLTPVVD